MTILVPIIALTSTTTQDIQLYNAGFTQDWMAGSATLNTTHATLQVTAAGTLPSAWQANATAWGTAIWTGAPASWPTEYWVEVQLAGVTGGYYTWLILQATTGTSGGSGYAWGFTTNVSTLQRYVNGALSGSMSITTGTLPATYAVGDRLRFGITGSGSSTVLHYSRGAAGAEPTEVATTTVTTNILPAGRPAFGHSSTGATGAVSARAINFMAGDYVTGPLPPAAPTAAKGVLNVRSTSQP